jgi:hypothetical protein
MTFIDHPARNTLPGLKLYAEDIPAFFSCRSLVRQEPVAWLDQCQGDDFNAQGFADLF